jgi:hypothetical protein
MMEGRISKSGEGWLTHPWVSKRSVPPAPSDDISKRTGPSM